jgi:hypothetical protein
MKCYNTECPKNNNGNLINPGSTFDRCGLMEIQDVTECSNYKPEPVKGCEKCFYRDELVAYTPCLKCEDNQFWKPMEVKAMDKIQITEEQARDMLSIVRHKKNIINEWKEAGYIKQSEQDKYNCYVSNYRRNVPGEYGMQKLIDLAESAIEEVKVKNNLK